MFAFIITFIVITFVIMIGSILFRIFNEVKYRKNSKKVSNEVKNEFLNKSSDFINKENSDSKKQIRCQKCYQMNDINNDYCTNCGEKLIKECPNCHEINEKDNLFCKKCGHKF